MSQKENEIMHGVDHQTAATEKMQTTIRTITATKIAIPPHL